MSTKLVLTAMRRQAGGNKYLTNNNQPAKYSHWGKLNPPGRVFGDCVVTWKSAMYQHDCKKQAHFVCEQNEFEFLFFILELYTKQTKLFRF